MQTVGDFIIYIYIYIYVCVCVNKKSLGFSFKIQKWKFLFIYGRIDRENDENSYFSTKLRREKGKKEIKESKIETEMYKDGIRKGHDRLLPDGSRFIVLSCHFISFFRTNRMHGILNVGE